MTAGAGSRWRVWHIDGLGAAGCAVLSGLAFLIVVQPVLRTRADQAAMRSELTEQVGQLAHLEDVDRTLGQDLERVTEQLAMSYLRLQPQQYLNAQMARIVELASASGIVIDQTRSGAAEAGERYQTVPVYLAGRGSYSNCAAFLHQLHETLPDTGVVAFELSGNPSDPGAPPAFEFDLIWYAAATSAAAKE